MDSWPDDKLVRQAQAGDLQAFGLLYDRHKDWVYGYVLFRVSSPEVAVDLVQDIFVQALQSLGRFQPGLSFGAWLNGITRHIVTDYLRRDYRRKERVPEIEGRQLDFEEQPSFPGPEETVLTVQVMQQILAGLNRNQRKLIELRLLEGRSTGETAELIYGVNNEEARRKITVGLYKAIQAARQLADRYRITPEKTAQE